MRFGRQRGTRMESMRTIGSAASEIEVEDTAGVATRRAPRGGPQRGAEKSEGRSPPRRGKARDELPSVRP